MTFNVFEKGVKFMTALRKPTSSRSSSHPDAEAKGFYIDYSSNKIRFSPSKKVNFAMIDIAIQKANQKSKKQK
jgi:hypothetical protein